MGEVCHYARMAINPECCSCDGKNKKCPGWTEPFETNTKEPKKRMSK